MAPVYTSDPALPRRPQDSVPACLLQPWPDGTCTHKQSSAWHDVLPGRGVADGRSPRIFRRVGRHQLAMAGKPTIGSSLNGALGDSSSCLAVKLRVEAAPIWSAPACFKSTALRV